jgi:hypothetical protein
MLDLPEMSRFFKLFVDIFQTNEHFGLISRHHNVEEAKLLNLRLDANWTRYVFEPNSWNTRVRIRNLVHVDENVEEEDLQIESTNSTDDDDRDVETWSVTPDETCTYHRTNDPNILPSRIPDKQGYLITNRLADQFQYVEAWNIIRMWMMNFAKKHNLHVIDPDIINVEKYSELTEETRVVLPGD